MPRIWCFRRELFRTLCSSCDFNGTASWCSQSAHRSINAISLRNRRSMPVMFTTGSSSRSLPSFQPRGLSSEYDITKRIHWCGVLLIGEGDAVYLCHSDNQSSEVRQQICCKPTKLKYCQLINSISWPKNTVLPWTFDPIPLSTIVNAIQIIFIRMHRLCSLKYP